MEFVQAMAAVDVTRGEFKTPRSQVEHLTDQVRAQGESKEITTAKIMALEDVDLGKWIQEITEVVNPVGTALPAAFSAARTSSRDPGAPGSACDLGLCTATAASKA